MLKSSVHSFGFLILGILVILLEGTALVYSTIYVNNFLINLFSSKVPSMFLYFLNPMFYIIGFTLGVVVIKYPIAYIKYYLKLSQIVFITTLILDYKPFKGSRYLYSLSQGYSTMVSSIATDLSVKQVIKVFNALRESIMKADVFQKFLNPKSTIVKIVSSMTSAGVKNTISQVDEIIMSYSWFTYSLYSKDAENNGRKISIKNSLKNRALFFLEGVAFTVRALPHLFMNSLLFELGFVILANSVVAISITTFIALSGFTWLKLFLCLALFRLMVKLFYYVFIDSFRLIIYLNIFYRTLDEMEPFNVDEILSSLLGKVPVLKKLVKKSGKKIEPAVEGDDSILNVNAKEIVRTHLVGVATAFNLDPDLLVPKKEESEEAIQENDSVESDSVVEDENHKSNEGEGVADSFDLEEPITQPEIPSTSDDIPSLEEILSEDTLELESLEDLEELEEIVIPGQTNSVNPF